MAKPSKKGKNYVAMEVAAKANAAPRATKKDGWQWTDKQGLHKDQWLAEGYEGVAPPRIKQLDRCTFACYRDGNYLGCEQTLEEAKARCALGRISEKNRVMRLWEEKHPDELPPGLQLTDGERTEYWRRHPPQAAKVSVARHAAPRPDEDPATARLRAELAAEGARGRNGRAKVAAAPRGDTADVPQGGLIRVKPGATVPKKPGSAAHGRWTLLWAHDGKTVVQYKKSNGNMTTLANAMARGLVTVEEAT